MKTIQEYYDMLVQAAQDGTFPSVRGRGCLYRGPGQKRCAIGLLIANDQMAREWDHEGTGWDTILVNIEPVEDFKRSDYQDVQNLHDDCAIEPWNPQVFVRNLNQLDCFAGVKQIDPTTLSKISSQGPGAGQECEESADAIEVRQGQHQAGS